MTNQRPEGLIPIDELEDRRIYEIRSRNLTVGVWNAATNGFIGLRVKFGDEYLFTEYHWDPPAHGTVSAVLWALPRGLVKPWLPDVVPDDILMAERLPGTWCSEHDREVEFRKNDPEGTSPFGKWFHLDDGSELAKDDSPTGKPNTALFTLLKMHDLVLKQYRLQFLLGRAVDEIYEMRVGAAHESLVIQEHLGFATIPKTRRAVMAEQVRRLGEAARGKAREAYAGIKSKEVLRAVGAETELTNFEWELEREERW